MWPMGRFIREGRLVLCWGASGLRMHNSVWGSTEHIVLCVCALAIALLGLYWTRRQTQHRYLIHEMGLGSVRRLSWGWRLVSPH